MGKEIKILPRSNKYRENWDNIFFPFDTDGAVYNWKTGKLKSKLEMEQEYAKRIQNRASF